MQPGSSKRILEGVVDTHIHVYPEISLKIPNAALDHEWLLDSIASGVRAVCLKSHYWPTAEKAHTLSKLFPEIVSCGGICLNTTVGGFNPFAVEVAVEAGARIVWFPTWSAANDVERKGYSQRVASFYGRIPTPYLKVTEDDGRLLPEVEQILDLLSKSDIALATGHLSVEESKLLIRRAKEKGIKRTVFTHALTAMVGASAGDQIELADLGAFIEHTFVATLPMHQQLSPLQIVDSIRAVGAERCIISTDAVFDWNPRPPEMMRMFIAMLLAKGIRPDEIDLMARHNPAFVLGLDGLES